MVASEALISTSPCSHEMRRIKAALLPPVTTEVKWAAPRLLRRERPNADGQASPRRWNLRTNAVPRLFSHVLPALSGTSLHVAAMVPQARGSSG